jgi:hypothetical protein
MHHHPTMVNRRFARENAHAVCSAANDAKYATVVGDIIKALMCSSS